LLALKARHLLLLVGHLRNGDTVVAAPAGNIAQ
jgi:hypothetical protein